LLDWEVHRRSRSFLAAEAINEYLDLNEWQVVGFARSRQGVSHEQIKEWVNSWNRKKQERPAPKRSAI
jgi:predicted transcriptional regulator